MKSTNKADNIAKAHRLHDVIHGRKVLQKEEDELKKHFKEIMGEDRHLDVGGHFLITLTPVTQNRLQKDLLISKFGKEPVESCMKASEYDKFEIVKQDPVKQAS